MKPRYLQIVAWGASIIATVLAFIAWGQGNAWQFSGLSTYQVFPLFGLLAFSLMWAHYIISALRQHFSIDRKALQSYFEVTSLGVLAAILLHPGLLAYQLWRDGAGLPPGSELHYRGPKMAIYILIAMISLVVFLVYELRRKYDKTSWWKFVQYASDIAILLILVHSLELGSQLQSGWFRTVWYFYGLTLIVSLAYIYYRKYEQHKLAKTSAK